MDKIHGDLLINVVEIVQYKVRRIINNLQTINKSLTIYHNTLAWFKTDLTLFLLTEEFWMSSD